MIYSVYAAPCLDTCDLGGARTLGPLIKSQLLYQLSYEVIFCRQATILVCGCKYAIYI